MSSGVIVGYDGSDWAKAALRVGLEVGRAYGEKVMIVSSYELNPVAGEIHDYHLAVKDLATRRLEDAKALTADGLFIGQSQEFFQLLQDLAEDADEAQRPNAV